MNRSLNVSEDMYNFKTEMMEVLEKPCNCCYDNIRLEKYWIDCWIGSLSEYVYNSDANPDIEAIANKAEKILEEKKYGFNRKNYQTLVTDLYNYHKKYDDDLEYEDMERMFVESLALGIVCEY